MASRLLEISRNNASFIGFLPSVAAGLVATLFDGTSDQAEIDAATSGLVDGDTLLASFWTQRPTGSGGFQVLNGNSGSDLFDFTPQVSLTRTLIRLDNTASAAYDFLYSTTYSPDVWNHYALAYDRTTGKRQRALNGVLTADTAGPTGLPLKLSNLIKFPPQNMGGTDCLVSEIYIGTGSLDLATALTRFRTAAGKPADLGDDGSLVTGTQPEIYCPTGDLSDNRGSGGNGTLTGAPVQVTGPGA